MVAALKIEVGKNPVPCWLCDDTEYLNRCVSQGESIIYMAAALKVKNGIAAIYCRNGHMFCFPGNRRVGERVVCGTFYIVRVKNGKLVSLSDADVVKYSLEYWEPESFTEDEIISSWLL